MIHSQMAEISTLQKLKFCKANLDKNRDFVLKY